jgi:DGQHR domain-containing protein
VIPFKLPAEIKGYERPFRLPWVKDYEEIEVSTQREARRLKRRRYRLARRRGKYVCWKYKPKWVIFEDEIREFLTALKFRDVGAGKLGKFPVEVYGGFGGTFLIVDCTMKKEPGYKSLWDKIYKIAGTTNNFKKAVRSRYRDKYREIKHVIPTRNIDVSTEHEDEARQNGITIWNEKYFEMYKNLFRAVGPLATYWILRELEARPKRIRDGTRKRYYEIPAFEIEEANTVRYTFLMRADLLAIIGYVSRILSGHPNAYQRTLYPAKINKIVKFLTEEHGRFPNNIIVNLKNVWFEPKRRLRENVRFGILHIPKVYASAEIIDGQHRLYGIWKAGGEFLNQELAVTAFKDLDPIEQGKTYVNINKHQKPVEASDLWDLAPIRDPKSKEAWISRIVKTLNKKEIFKNKIYIPSESGRSRRSYKIHLASFCDGIKHTKLLERLNPNMDSPAHVNETVEDAVTLLNDFFKFVGEIGSKISKKWNKSFFFVDNGLNVMLRIYGYIVDHLGRIPSKEEIRKYLSSGLFFYCDKNTHRISELVAATSSEGGRNRIARHEIATIITQAIPSRGFAGIELLHIQNMQKFPRLVVVRAEIPEFDPLCKEYIRRNMFKCYRKSWPKKLEEKFPDKYPRWSTSSQRKGGKDVLDGTTFGECVEIIRSFSSAFKLGDFEILALNTVAKHRGDFIHPVKPSDIDISKKKYEEIQKAFEMIRKFVQES